MLQFGQVMVSSKGCQYSGEPIRIEYLKNWTNQVAVEKNYIKDTCGMIFN